MIKPAYSFSFLLSINLFVWQNVLYFLDAPPYKVIPSFRYTHSGVRLSWNRTITPTAHPQMVYTCKEAKADVRKEKQVEPPLSTTNYTCIAPALNSGLREEQPANNRLTKQGSGGKRTHARVSPATTSVAS